MATDGLIEEARLVGSLCDSSDVDMILITGSVARRLSDRSSDIDLYVYRSGDAATSRSMAGALKPSQASLVFGVATPTGRFEKFRLAGRHVDVEQVSSHVLESLADRISAAEVTENDIKVAAGIRDAVAVVGTETLIDWQRRLVLTDRVAVAEVARLGGALLSPRTVYDLTWARSDELSYVARVSTILLRGVGILGAINRRWMAVDDPKWLPWQIEQLALRPRDVTSRMRAAVTNPTSESTDDAADLLTEILDLADTHIDGADTRAARFALRLRP